VLSCYHSILIFGTLPHICFAEGMTHAGVLVAIPALVAGGLLSTVEKIYGSLGPAFYGLRTTLVACVSVGPAEDSSSRGAQRIFARGTGSSKSRSRCPPGHVFNFK